MRFVSWIYKNYRLNFCLINFFCVVFLTQVLTSNGTTSPNDCIITPSQQNSQTTMNNNSNNQNNTPNLVATTTTTVVALNTSNNINNTNNSSTNEIKKEEYSTNNHKPLPLTLPVQQTQSTIPVMSYATSYPSLENGGTVFQGTPTQQFSSYQQGVSFFTFI